MKRALLVIVLAAAGAIAFRRRRARLRDALWYRGGGWDITA